MRALLPAIIISCLIAGCDGSLRYRGSVSSSVVSLENCHVALSDRGSKEVMDFEHFNPPEFSGSFLVQPTDREYLLTVTCKNHVPKHLVVRYQARGGAIELGNVRLTPVSE